MTRSEIEAKIAEAQAQGKVLQQENQQLTQQLKINQLELSKLCGKIELLNEMLSACDNQPTEGETKEAEKDADKNDNG